jgi:uncharacterized protein (TIGR02145 family)
MSPNLQAMKSIFVLATVLALSTIIAFGQRPTMELTFTALDSADWVQLDSIKVMNLTQGGETVLYYPDTVLVLDLQVGVPEVRLDNTDFRVYQNYPNPVADQTTISLFIPEKDRVGIIITDILGRTTLQLDKELEKGMHSFRFNPGNGNICFFTAQWRGHRSSIKILNLPSGDGAGSLEYIGNIPQTPFLKAEKAVQEFPFNLGDELLYIGYSDTLQSGILDTPEESTAYTFQFATNIPCPGTPTVEYEGQVYNTIQIFSQCWLKENLNVGEMISGDSTMTDNDTIEKYCYNNEPDSCIKYGGLYQWNEMMQYTSHLGAQGICPPGWHLPTDEEWKVLEGAADSYYGIGDNSWNDWGYRGTDAGTNLKATSGWHANGNGTDLFGFSGLPGGCHSLYPNGIFQSIGFSGFCWSSTKEYYYSFHLGRHLSYLDPGVERSAYWGKVPRNLSVRCLRDD